MQYPYCRPLIATAEPAIGSIDLPSLFAAVTSDIKGEDTFVIRGTP